MVAVSCGVVCGTFCIISETLSYAKRMYLTWEEWKIVHHGTGKGKVHPRAGHENPKGEQSYRTTLSLISAPDGVAG